MKKRRVFDEPFRKMARTGGPVELSHAKGSVQEAARELGPFAGAIDSSRITKWRQNHKSPGQLVPPTTGLSEEQKQIKQLQRELKDAQLERDILKASSPGATAPADRGNSPICSGTRQPISR